MTPEPWEFALLALAVYRVWRLLAEDDILDRPRRWLLRLGDDWEKDGDPVPDDYRIKWGQFLTCPWCAGFWIAALTYSMWIAVGPGEFDSDELLMAGVTLMALSGAVGAIAHFLTLGAE